MKELANLLADAVSEAIANVSYESKCPDFHGVINFNVSDGWTKVEVTLS